MTEIDGIGVDQNGDHRRRLALVQMGDGRQPTKSEEPQVVPFDPSR